MSAVRPAVSIQRRLARGLLWIGVGALLLGAMLAAGLYWRYGGGAAFPDRSTAPLWPESALETVAELDYPPGNLAVSASGRVFFTYHPEARPPLNLAEWVDGQAVAWPSAAWQPGGDHPQALNEVLSIRIDAQQRLWALDNGTHGLRPGRLLAFDLATGEQVHRFEFPRDIAGYGSHLNDFQVSPDGQSIYIADASFFGQTPAIIVYDLRTQTARRVIEKHESVLPEHYLPVVQGRAMAAFGLVAIRPGVDSIGLSPTGDWLYFAPVTNNYLYRIPTRHLRDAGLSATQIQRKIQRFGLKTMSDGITLDEQERIYLSDLEHSAIVRMDSGGELTTLLKSERLRWPDGFSFGPDGWLYVSCSSLHQVIGVLPSQTRRNAPFQIFRVKTDSSGIPGR